MGYFYEDFLTEIDTKYAPGKYVFAGSISPEASAPGSGGNSLVNNSTFDIVGAKFCLESLLKVCNLLDVQESAEYPISKWEDILGKLPPYLVNAEGALAEWSWPGMVLRMPRSMPQT